LTPSSAPQPDSKVHEVKSGKVLLVVVKELNFKFTAIKFDNNEENLKKYYMG
jgi:hypothetical protein